MTKLNLGQRLRAERRHGQPLTENILIRKAHFNGLFVVTSYSNQKNPVKTFSLCTYNKYSQAMSERTIPP